MNDYIYCKKPQIPQMTQVTLLQRGFYHRRDAKGAEEARRESRKLNVLCISAVFLQQNHGWPWE